MSDTREKIASWLLNPDNPGIIEDAEKKLKDHGLEKIFSEIELPLIEVLATMEKRGISLDHKSLIKLLNKINQQIKSLEKKIYQQAGEQFNINSPPQLSRILFHKLQIKTKIGKTKSGFISTRAERLLNLKNSHPIINLILRYREAFKIRSTYLKPLSKSGNRAHTTFFQTSTATGRLSSRNPNLQNIPPAVKKIFVADKGYQLVSFDYSQLELKILAFLSKDHKMLTAFEKGQDIHKLTASQIFNVDIKKITKEMRQLAKTLNFGVIYGIGAAAFARTSGLSLSEARHFISEYFSDFVKIKKWQEKVKQETRIKGYVENLNGRKRWLPAINSANRFLAAEAERMAINMPVQSLGADIIKLAMIKIHRRFKNSMSVRLLLSIHDELLFEIEDDKLKESIKEIKKIIEEAYSPFFQLKVNVAWGKNWGNLIQ